MSQLVMNEGMKNQLIEKEKEGPIFHCSSTFSVIIVAQTWEENIL